MLLAVIGTIIIAYVIGSIPFGLLLVRAFGLGDVRAIGSGSTGATNVMRTGKKSLGVATLLLDAAKGAGAIFLIIHLYGVQYAPLAGLMVVMGHVFPVWLRFKGGKGVATTIGVMLAINWILALCVCVVWLLVFYFSRISSIASLLSIGYSGVIAYVVDNYFTALLCLCLAGIIVFSHRENIFRLISGKEHSFRKLPA